jgi:hypothetical protein
MVGNPAKQIGWACECGRRLPPSSTCSCGRAYRDRDGAGPIADATSPAIDSLSDVVAGP